MLRVLQPSTDWTCSGQTRERSDWQPPADWISSDETRERSEWHRDCPCCHHLSDLLSETIQECKESLQFCGFLSGVHCISSRTVYSERTVLNNHKEQVSRTWSDVLDHGSRCRAGDCWCWSDKIDHGSRLDVLHYHKRRFDCFFGQRTVRVTKDEPTKRKFLDSKL